MDHLVANYPDANDETRASFANAFVASANDMLAKYLEWWRRGSSSELPELSALLDIIDSKLVQLYCEMGDDYLENLYILVSKSIPPPRLEVVEEALLTNQKHHALALLHLSHDQPLRTLSIWKSMIVDDNNKGDNITTMNTTTLTSTSTHVVSINQIATLLVNTHTDNRLEKPILIEYTEWLLNQQQQEYTNAVASSTTTSALTSVLALFLDDTDQVFALIDKTLPPDDNANKGSNSNNNNCNKSIKLAYLKHLISNAIPSSSSSSSPSSSVSPALHTLYVTLSISRLLLYQDEIAEINSSYKERRRTRTTRPRTFRQHLVSLSSSPFTPSSTAAKLRLELLNHLQEYSHAYSIPDVLKVLEEDEKKESSFQLLLHIERATLYAKQGRHLDYLVCMCHQVADSIEAEAYCAKQQQQHQLIKHVLFSLYLDPLYCDYYCNDIIALITHYAHILDILEVKKELSPYTVLLIPFKQPTRSSQHFRPIGHSRSYPLHSHPG